MRIGNIIKLVVVCLHFVKIQKKHANTEVKPLHGIKKLLDKGIYMHRLS